MAPNWIKLFNKKLEHYNKKYLRENSSASEMCECDPVRTPSTWSVDNAINKNGNSSTQTTHFKFPLLLNSNINASIKY